MLAHLSLLNFRNLEPLKWGPGPGSHLLLGGNGAGKTSVLEAVYVLATTHSFRAARRDYEVHSFARERDGAALAQPLRSGADDGGFSANSKVHGYS